MKRILLALLLFLLGGAATPALAQVGYSELNNYYRPGVYVPYDGMSYQMRYNYYPAWIETGVGYGQTFRYYEKMEWIDRQDRAARFADANLLPFERMGPIFGRGESPVLFSGSGGWFRRN